MGNVLFYNWYLDFTFYSKTLISMFFIFFVFTFSKHQQFGKIFKTFCEGIWIWGAATIPSTIFGTLYLGEGGGGLNFWDTLYYIGQF